MNCGEPKLFNIKSLSERNNLVMEPHSHIVLNRRKHIDFYVPVWFKKNMVASSESPIKTIL